MSFDALGKKPVCPPLHAGALKFHPCPENAGHYLIALTEAANVIDGWLKTNESLGSVVPKKIHLENLKRMLLISANVRVE